MDIKNYTDLKKAIANAGYESMNEFALNAGVRLNTILMWSSRGLPKKNESMALSAVLNCLENVRRDKKGNKKPASRKRN